MTRILSDLGGTLQSDFRIRPAVATGAPTAGTYRVGTLHMDSDGVLWRCSASGSPGTWVGLADAGSGVSGSGAYGRLPYWTAGSTLSSMPLTSTNGTFLSISTSTPAGNPLLSLINTTAGTHSSQLMMQNDGAAQVYAGVTSSTATSDLGVNRGFLYGVGAAGIVIGSINGPVSIIAGSTTEIRTTFDVSGNVGIGVSPGSTLLAVGGSLVTATSNFNTFFGNRLGILTRASGGAYNPLNPVDSAAIIASGQGIDLNTLFIGTHSSNASGMVLNTYGVGVGGTPSSSFERFRVETVSTSVANDCTAAFILNYARPSSAASRSYYASYHQLQVDVANNNLSGSSVMGVISLPVVSPAGNAVVGNVFGYHAYPQVANNGSSGTTVSVNNVYGLYSALYMAASTAGATSSVTNYYGLFLAAPSTTTGAGTKTLTNRYGIYQEDTAAFNLLCGNTQVGVAGSKHYLRVDGGNAAANEGSFLWIVNGGNSTGAVGNYSAVHGGAYVSTMALWGSAGIYFGASGVTTAMLLDTAGNLGIGTPGVASTKLHAYGTGDTRITVESTTNSAVFQAKSGTSYSYFFTDASGNLRLYSNSSAGWYGHPTTGQWGLAAIPVSGFGYLQVGPGTSAVGDQAEIASFCGTSVATGTTNTANVAIHSYTAYAQDMGGSLGLGGRYNTTQFATFAMLKGSKGDSVLGNYGGYLSLLTRINGGSLVENARLTQGGNLVVSAAPVFTGTPTDGVGGRFNVSTDFGTILLAGSDRPKLVWQHDRQTSGTYSGYGRWGYQMFSAVSAAIVPGTDYAAGAGGTWAVTGVTAAGAATNVFTVAGGTGHTYTSGCLGVQIAPSSAHNIYSQRIQTVQGLDATAIFGEYYARPSSAGAATHSAALLIAKADIGTSLSGSNVMATRAYTMFYPTATSTVSGLYGYYTQQEVGSTTGVNPSVNGVYGLQPNLYMNAVAGTTSYVGSYYGVNVGSIGKGGGTGTYTITNYVGVAVSDPTALGITPSTIVHFAQYGESGFNEFRAGLTYLGRTSGYGYLQFGNYAATATYCFHIGSQGDGTLHFYNGQHGAGTGLGLITSGGQIRWGELNPSVNRTASNVEVQGAVSAYTASSASACEVSAVSRLFYNNGGGNNFAGLIMRYYDTAAAGSAYSATSANAAFLLGQNVSSLNIGTNTGNNINFIGGTRGHAGNTGNRLGYLSAAGNLTLYNTPNSGGAFVSGWNGAAADYSMIMTATNDGGNKLVMFLNGSTRAADGGTNCLTIRNDGGGMQLGHASYATNYQSSLHSFLGGPVVVYNQLLSRRDGVVASASSYDAAQIQAQTTTSGNTGYAAIGFKRTGIDAQSLLFGGNAAGSPYAFGWYNSDGTSGDLLIRRRMAVAGFQNAATLAAGIYQNNGDGLQNPAGTAVSLYNWWHVINMLHTDYNGYNAQIAVNLSVGGSTWGVPSVDAANWMFVRKATGNAWNEWSRVLTSEAGIERYQIYRGADPISVPGVANGYLHLGAPLNATNGGYRMITAGYHSGTTYAPVAFGYQQTSLSGFTLGDFVVATRSGTTDTAPAVALRVLSSGRTIINELSVGSTLGLTQFEVAGTAYFASTLQVSGTLSAVQVNATALNANNLTVNSGGQASFAGASTIDAAGRFNNSTGANYLCGYTAGAGGAVTQITSTSTAVTLNKPSGTITTVTGSTWAANSVTVFQFNNTNFQGGTLVLAHIVIGSTSLLADIINTGSGAAQVRVVNPTSGSISSQITIRYMLFFAAAA